MDLPTPEDLWEWRKQELGLTQSELAERAGVSQPLIARIEGGDVDPRLSTLRRIVTALEEAESGVTHATDIMHTDVVSIAPDDAVSEAKAQMAEHDFSQLPVVDGTTPVGMISLGDIMEAADATDIDITELPVSEVMNESNAAVEPDATREEVRRHLEHHDAVVVKERGATKGIITEADVVESYD
jgi:predicted transcriptional regulator